jgi:hypothetical protein
MSMLSRRRIGRRFLLPFIATKPQGVQTMDLTELVAVMLTVMKLFEMIARLTPTTRDDNLVQKLRKFAAVFGLALPDRRG